ncbi:MAG: SDR family oxidoreductase [Pyrinomonadaceae bacterium]
MQERPPSLQAASRGVGRATAIRLAEGGANVIINYLSNSAEAAETAQRRVHRKRCGRYHGSGRRVGMRVAQSVVQACHRELSTDRPFGLQCRASGKSAPIEECWTRTFGIRSLTRISRSAWAMTKASVPTMKKQPSASIVLVSSTAGQRGEANYSNYAASKGGQIAFTKALASELSPTIRVNAVAPGWIETAMVRPAFEDKEYEAQVIDSIPLKRVATTDDVALSICFLLSDWSRHITGEILNINGGAVLCG